MAAILSMRGNFRNKDEKEGHTMFHEYAPLAAFIGLILVIAGSAAFGQRQSLLSLALVAIGAALNVAPYL